MRRRGAEEIREEGEKTRFERRSTVRIDREWATMEAWVVERRGEEYVAVLRYSYRTRPGGRRGWHGLVDELEGDEWPSAKSE
jgi:hypothetical protein